MADYLVIKGKDRATIEIAQETKVVFPFTFNVVVVKATSGSVTVSLSAGAQSGDDGTDTIAEGDSTVFSQLTAKEIYISGSGTVKVWAGVRPEFCPFSKGGKGGGSSGDGTHYKGTTTTALSNGSTTNPITIDGESYTAVFGDIAVYNYTEFVFDGTQWSEFGRPFDTTPTSGSANAVTSDGMYNLLRKGTTQSSVSIGSVTNQATGSAAVSMGYYTKAPNNNMVAMGVYNNPKAGYIFTVGNGADSSHRNNILEANYSTFNVNGDIKKNNVSLPTPYTTMPTITESMLGQIAQYVGETTSDYVKGYFYIAASDGATEPTYYWQPVDKPAYTLTTLWEYDGVDNIDTVGTVICSEAELAEYDFVGMLYGFRQMTSGIVTGQYSFAPTMAMPETLMSSASFATAGSAYYNGRIGISNGNLKISAVANNTYESQGVNFRMGIYKVVAIKFGVSDAAGSNTDNYTTTERKIGKWIDGSDLYQRTFDNVAISNNNGWNENVLGTSGIEIVDVKGLCKTAMDTKYMYPLNYYRDTGITICTCINSDATDINIRPCMPSESAVIAVRITIQYTKPSVQANLMQTAPPTEDVSETPAVEEDDMR